MNSFIANSAGVMLLAALTLRAWLYFNPEHEDHAKFTRIWQFLVWPLACVAYFAAAYPSMPPAVWAACGCGLWIAVRIAKGYFFKGKGNGDSHRRGHSLVSTQKVINMTKKESWRALLGQVPIPCRAENYHFLLAGSPGAGKSQAFHQLLAPARETDAAIVADVGGEFVSRYWRVGDMVLNPLDKRCAPWSPLAEMEGSWDAKRIAELLIPTGEGSAAEWNGYAQNLLAAVLQKQFDSGTGSNGELVRLLTVADNSELAAVCTGTPAAQLFADGAEKMLASIRAIIATYIAPLGYLDQNAGESSFSLRKMIQQDNKKWVFLIARDDQLAMLKPLIACWVAVSISALLSLQPSPSRRVWFALDEFASFGRIAGIEDLLTKGRKYGASVIIGLQTISQSYTAYGQHGARTLLACLGTWLSLRVADGETAEYMSQNLGEREIDRVNQSQSDNGASTTTVVTKERLIVPSELQNLRDRVGVLNVVGETPACWVTVPVANLPQIAEPFVARGRN